jgi:hypothetical protein
VHFAIVATVRAARTQGFWPSENPPRGRILCFSTAAQPIDSYVPRCFGSPRQRVIAVHAGRGGEEFNIRRSGRPRRLLTEGSHRSGRADFPHPAL